VNVVITVIVMTVIKDFGLAFHTIKEYIYSFMSLFQVSKLLMTIDSRDSRDSASIVSILCKKVNE